MSIGLVSSRLALCLSLSFEDGETVGVELYLTILVYIFDWSTLR